MTIVLVHGNPETDVIWRPMLRELGRDDVICLSPPGYGAPVPDRFGASWIEYRDWLIGELEQIGHPVHLVGHDWGGLHAVSVATTRPDLLLSWTVDVIGMFDPEYVWHDWAQGWRTIDKGEVAVEELLGGTVEERIQANMAVGVANEEVAQELAVGQNQTMIRCLLALYRSAPEAILHQMAERLPEAAVVPGFVIIAAEDDVIGTVEMRRRTAKRVGATVAELPLHHWWMLQDPKLAAQTLTSFWDSMSPAPAQA